MEEPEKSLSDWRLFCFFFKMLAGMEKVRIFAATNLTTRAERQRTRVRLFCIYAYGTI
jgi:hypothetical protein